MAKKPNKETSTAPAAAPTSQPQGFPYMLLAALVAETVKGPETFLFTTEAERAPLVEAGMVLVNTSAVEPGTGRLATRASDAGIAADNAAKVAAAAAGNPAAASGFGAPVSTPAAPAPAPAAAAKPSFALVSSVPIPDRKRGSIGPRGETYPFGTMEVGQAFFIPATADKPNPERSFASSVASAVQRYAVEKTPQEMRKNRKGRDVAVTVKTRDFVMRRVDDGAAFGHPGVAGAGVWRTL